MSWRKRNSTKMKTNCSNSTSWKKRTNSTSWRKTKRERCSKNLRAAARWTTNSVVVRWNLKVAHSNSVVARSNSVAARWNWEVAHSMKARSTTMN
jgi:hypothetical protein